MNLFDLGKKYLNNSWMIILTSEIYSFVYFNKIRGRKGNTINHKGAYLKKSKIVINGKGNEIHIGEKCFLNKSSIIIHGNNNRIIIEDMCVLHNACLYIENDGGTINIGWKSLICGPCQLAVIEGTKIDIGKECLFSSDTEIRTGDSHSVLSLDGVRINQSQDVVLGNHTWIGHRAMLLKGSKTANNTTVSTGAIVTKEFNEAHVVLAGVPAKVVKRDVDWCLERL